MSYVQRLFENRWFSALGIGSWANPIVPLFGLANTPNLSAFSRLRVALREVLRDSGAASLSTSTMKVIIAAVKEAE